MIILDINTVKKKDSEEGSKANSKVKESNEIKTK